MKRFVFETYPGHSLHVFFFVDVANASEVLTAIRSGNLEIAFMSPTLVPPKPIFLIITCY